MLYMCVQIISKTHITISVVKTNYCYLSVMDAGKFIKYSLSDCTLQHAANNRSR